MRVAILIADSNSACPVPASKGGAVATLVEHIVKENNKRQLIDLEIVSFYDEKAYEISKQYPNIKFHWIHISKFVKKMDALIFNIIRTFFKNKKAISYKSTCSLITYIFKSSKYIKKENFDKIIIENNILLFWTLKLKGNSEKYKGKYYFHLHNVPRINGKCKKEIMNCKKFLCVSRYVGNEIASNENAIGPVDDSKIFVLQNCIDTAKFAVKKDMEKKQYYRKKFGISHEDKIILFAGRLTSEKGIDKIIESLPMVKSVNAKLLIVGSNLVSGQVKNDFENRLKQLAEPVKDRVIFTGYIMQEEMPYIYNLANVAVFPSMWEEPAGLTMIEAMSCGIPVITTYSGGIPEYSGGFSILLERNNMLCTNIAYNIDRILEDQKYAQDLGENGAKHVHENFAVNKYLDMLLSLIKDNN